jgi:hypothetical protein
MATKKKKYSLVDKLLLPIAVVLAIALLLGVLAGNMDPRKHAIIAFFGLAYPFVLFVNIIFLVWWFLSKKWIFAIATVLVIALGAKTLKATFAIGGDEGLALKKQTTASG